MTAPEAAELRARVEESGVRELAEKGGGRAAEGAGSKGADMLEVAVTVEDEGGSRTVRLGEEALTRGVRALIAWVDSAPGRAERVGRHEP